MFGEINVEVEDGNLGRNSGTEVHAQAKIGVSDAEGGTPILITSAMKPEDIKGKLGYTPLADACIDAAENGLKTIYAIPVRADIPGEIGEVTHTGTGEGTLTAQGNPNNAYDIVVQITETGGANEGCFRYSIDGGNNFSHEHTIPLSGEFEMQGTGVKLVFAETEGAGFMEDDAYAFSTTAPTMNNAGVLAAVEKLLNCRTWQRSS